MTPSAGTDPLPQMGYLHGQPNFLPNNLQYRHTYSVPQEAAIRINAYMYISLRLQLDWAEPDTENIVYSHFAMFAKCTNLTHK